MSKVRIYQPAKTAMHSGRANTRRWVLEHEPGRAQRIDPLMGWAGAADTRGQVRMTFDSRDEAVAFAKKNGFEYRVVEPRTRRIRPKNYADNFSADRVR